MITRAEHLAWCKKRALEYLDRGNLNDAFKSMMSDLGKHPETANPAAQELGILSEWNVKRWSGSRSGWPSSRPEQE